MGQQLSRGQKLLYKRIDEILFYVWDPIGVAPEPRTRDEYEMYLPQVFKLALENEDPKLIADYLHNITNTEIGLPSKLKNCIETAEIILKSKHYIDEMLSLSST